MVQCYDCGALCGKSNPTSWRNEHFWCDKCARKHSKATAQFILGMLFLVFAAVLAGAFACVVLRPIASAAGYDTAKGCAIGFGIGGIAVYAYMRHLAKTVDGCLVRMITKTVGFLALATGIGLLIVTFFKENVLKNIVCVETSNESSAAVQSE